MDHKITINNKEYDRRNFTDEQHRVLNVVLMTNTDIDKAQARLDVMRAGREVALDNLVKSLEATEQPTPGESND